jgi:uncharacterized membrane protein
LYIYILFLHLIAAIMGLGAAFAFPVIAKSAKTVKQAQFMLSLLKKLEIFPKIGGITLLLTGLIMGFLNTSLFTSGWFIISIVIYLGVQVIVAGLMPKNMKKQLEILHNHKGDELPQEYKMIGKQSAKLEGIVHLMAVVLVVLMVFKPF